MAGKPERSNSATPKDTARLLLALALALAAICYVNTLSFAFVYDDLPQLVNNPRVHSWEHAPRLFAEQVRTSVLAGTWNYYRPIFVLWLLVQYSLFGLSPWAYHLANVLIHIAVVGLSYVLFRQITGDRLTAAMGAVLFAVHPTHVESVAWISGVTDPLCALFVVGSFVAYIKAREADRAIWQAAALTLYALAMLSKETAVVLPALLMLYEWLIAKRDSLGSAAKRLAPFAIATIVYLVVRHWVLLGFMHPEQYTVRAVLLTLPRVLWFYAHHLVWPAGLSVFYDTPLVETPGLWDFWLPLVGVALFCAALVWVARRSRVAAFGGAWMLAMLAPALVGILVFIPEELTHDRYLYLPSIGFALLIAVTLRRLPSGGELLGGPRAQVAATLILGALMAAGTAAQNVYWTNDLILYAHGMNTAPRNVVAIDHMANEFYKRKRPSTAIELYRQALAIKPQLWQTHFALGLTLYELGRYEEATKALEGGAQVAPENAEQFYFIGLSQLSLANNAPAEEAFRKALQRNPQRPGANNALATALLRQGKVEEAKKALQAEIALTHDRSAVLELERLEKK